MERPRLPNQADLRNGRSIVQNVIGISKTESSQKPVPAHDDLALRNEVDLPSYLFHTSSIYWRRTEDYAGAAASLDDRVSLDTYTQAVTTEKGNAQDAIVSLLFPEKAQEM